MRAIHWQAALCFALYFASQTVVALTFDYDARRSPLLRPCDEHAAHGRVEQAKACYGKVRNSPVDYGVRAEAMWAANEFATANSLFREAARLDRVDPYVRLRWGRLFLGTHQHNEALKLFREAAKLDPEDLQAQLAIARVLVERYEGEARSVVTAALKKNGDLIEGHLLLARMLLEDGELDAAEPHIERAITLAERTKAPPLEGWALRAALEALRGGKHERWLERVSAYNPRYGGAYELLAHFEVVRRRYHQAVQWLQRAVEAEPTLASARAELGVNLLRIGATVEGQQQLAKAYDADPFNVATVNTLRLLDRFDEYDVSVGDGVILRLHGKEARALKPYVLELAQKSIATYSQRYGFKLKEPVTIEFYPNHDDFAVRIGGLPGIGLLGVTFGYLVAMDSPSGRAAGDFHWGSTLWHEMAHVFTLELTEHRVPRWLSEGVSVFEEWRTGPTPGVAPTQAVLEKFAEGKLLSVAELDAGFIRPSYADQIQVSYMQAGLTCLFIEQRFGFDKLVELLRQYQRETTVGDAIQAVFKLPVKEFDGQFADFMRQRYAKALANRKELHTLQEQAAKAAEAREWRALARAAQAMIDIDPEAVESGGPYMALAHAYAELHDDDAQLRTLLAYRAAGGWDPEALKKLAALLQARGRNAEAIDAWLAVNYSNPLQVDTHGQAGEQLLTSGREAEAAREFGVMLALNAPDPVPAHFGLARALYAQGERTQARRHLLDALAIAPHFKPAQQFLLQSIEESASHE